MQYAISFSDIMDTYGKGVNVEQDNFYTESLTGLINAEIAKGSTFEQVVYVNNRPSIVVFDSPNGGTALRQTLPKVKRPTVRKPPTEG